MFAVLVFKSYNVVIFVFNLSYYVYISKHNSMNRNRHVLDPISSLVAVYFVALE